MRRPPGRRRTSAPWTLSSASSRTACGTYTDDEHFFDLLAEDVVFDFVITVPGYPRHVVGRDNLIELFRGYGRSFFLDSCDDLRVHHDPDTSTVVLEYSSHGTVVGTGYPYSNRYISVITIKDRKIVGWRDYLGPAARLRCP